MRDVMNSSCRVVRVGAAVGCLRLLCRLGVLCIPLLAGAQPLPELYRSALAADPAVAAAQAQVRAAEQRVVQARAAFGPVVAFTANQSETRYNEAPSFETRPFTAKQVAVQLTQPLLRSVLLPSLQAARAQVEQAQAALEQAQGESMQRFVESNFDLLKARDVLAFVQAQRAATAEQLAAAQRSFKVGTAPITDVREAEAKADTVAAQLVAAEFDLDLKQQVLAVLVGHPVSGLLERGLSGEQLPELQASSVNDWLGSALTQSPQVRQAMQARDAATAEVEKARQAHAPTAELTYSHTMASDTGSPTTLLPRRADSRQIGVSLNVPLFASGATQSKVAEAMALRDRAERELDAARRNATLAVRQGFSATLSALSQARGLEAAVRSNELALRANRRGYEVGMRVNAEVLESQTKLFEARRELSRARYDAWINFVKLNVAAGRQSEAELVLLESLLLQQPAPALQGSMRQREERP
jgi:outer membrane protein